MRLRAYVSPKFFRLEVSEFLRGAGVILPLLDLVEALEQGNGDENNDSLLAVADLNLW